MANVYESKYPNLPKFKYHPDPISSGAFKDDKIVECSVCKDKTNVYYKRPFYSKMDIEFICPNCISSGKAAKDFEGEFTDQFVENMDKNKMDELCERTPAYISWQQEEWRTHCDDFCEFIGDIGWSDIEAMGIESDLSDDLKGYDLDFVKEIKKNGSIAGYLFRCLHCGKYRLHVDFD